MTKEEKAKAYDEALKRAEAAIDIAADKDLVKGVATTIFPELAESEDERIREWLIDTIKAVPNDSIEWDVIDKSCVLAYLEKQKAAETPQWMIDFLNDILSSCIIYDDYVRRQEYQSKVLGIIKWLENQKEKTPQWIIDFLKEIRPYSINKEEYEGYGGRIEFESKILAIIKWLEGNFIQQKEQKQSITIDQLKSLMLQYLQEAANEKNDSDIEEDTDKWARKILRYDFEQKPEVKLTGWVARDECSALYLYLRHPSRLKAIWVGNFSPLNLSPELFPDLKWEDEPMEVELTIRKNSTL